VIDLTEQSPRNEVVAREKGNRNTKPKLAYYAIDAMCADSNPAKYKVRNTAPIYLSLDYLAQSSYHGVTQSQETFQGSVNSVLFTDVVSTKARKSEHFVNATSVSVVLTEAYTARDGTCLTHAPGTPLRVMLSNHFVMEDKMRGKLQTGGSKPLFLHNPDHRENFIKMHKQLTSRLQPGDHVRLSPQPPLTNKAGAQFVKYQVVGLFREEKNVNKDAEWTTVQQYDVFSVVGQAKTSSRVPAIYHGQPTTPNVASPTVWSTPGWSCVMKTNLGCIPNAGTKFVVDKDLNLRAHRPFESAGVPSVAASISATSECTEHDEELEELPDSFDYDCNFTRHVTNVDAALVALHDVTLDQHGSALDPSQAPFTTGVQSTTMGYV
jgi:hypothetical protein